MGWLQKSDTTEHGFVEERLSAYLDGDLSPQERAAVDHHLARCQDCRWNLATLRQTVQWTRELSPVLVPRVFTLPVPVQAVRAPRPRGALVPLFQGATALVALLLVFVVAGDVMLSGSLGAPAPRSAAPSYAPTQPAAMAQATVVVEITKEVELEAAGMVEETQVAEALPPSAVEKAVEMPATAAPQPAAPQATPTAEAAMMAQLLAPTATVAGEGGMREATPPAIGGGPSEPEATEVARALASAVAPTMTYITGAVEALATRFPSLTLTVPREIGAPTSSAGDLVPSESTTATLMALPTEAPLPTVVVVAAPAMLTTATPVPLPTEAPLPAATAELAPAALPKVALSALPPEAAPPAVAEMQMHDQSFAAEQGEERGGAWQAPLVPWLRVAEIALGIALVLLAMATLVIMIRRRRAG